MQDFVKITRHINQMYFDERAKEPSKETTATANRIISMLSDEVDRLRTEQNGHHKFWKSPLRFSQSNPNSSGEITIYVSGVGGDFEMKVRGNEVVVTRILCGESIDDFVRDFITRSREQ